MRKRRNFVRITRSAFTLLEILIVLAIVGILAAILLPLFNAARESGRSATCQSNLHQIGLAMRLYVQDNAGFWPDPLPYGLGLQCSWPERIYPYVKSSAVFQCPNAPQLIYAPGCGPDDNNGETIRTFDGAYAMNDLRQGTVVRINDARFGNPSGTIVVLDGKGNFIGLTAADAPLETPQDVLNAGVVIRHRNGSNLLYADGHVKWRSVEQLTRRAQWTLQGEG